MKTLSTLIVLAATAFVSIAAQAQSVDSPSRDAVTAELQRARANGELDHAAREIHGRSAPISQIAYQAAGAAPVKPGATAKSRLDVQAELARARANGELDWAAAELNGAQQRGTPTTAMATR